MPSSTQIINNNTKTHHESKTSNDNSKKRSKMNKPILSYPVMPPTSEDWVLIPDDVRRKKHSSSRDARPYDHDTHHSSTKSKMDRTLRNAIDHIEAVRKTASSTGYIRQQHGKRAERNAEYHEDSFVRRRTTGAPPPAPSPPSLDTPDVSDVEEDDYWSCCRSSTSDERPSDSAR